MSASGFGTAWWSTSTVRELNMPRIVLLLLVSVLCQPISAQYNLGRSSNCYDRSNRPQRCTPPFQNAAFSLPVEATNTCGMQGSDAKEYCLQTGVTGATKSCDICDSRDPFKSHPPSYLTDFNNNDNVTWWQSETMLFDVQYPYSVNLTLRLGKTFEITYVRLKFYSSRPESFAIYKKTTENGPWIPYQFYSASCEDTYSRRTRDIITRNDETKAICTDEFSDISPLTGGSVAFSTLEGRPSAYDFENSQVLQEWVTATDIKIGLNRLNTFGDEVFRDPAVLKSYFYAISDFAVGGKCKCNGHASECVRSTGQGLEEKLVCRCQHNTMGAACEECLSFYQDKPWGRATISDAHECQACDCNDLSNRCFFDEDLYRRTGHGGHCLDCRENTAGMTCERCKDNFYRRSESDRCQSCGCDPVGSENTQCDNTGRCRCKPGVTGDKCDRCQPNYYDLGPAGCRPCACVVAGSRDNNPSCLPNTGVCTCKENVEGQNCDRCKPGFFNLDGDDKLGCMACFCYNHASICSSMVGYSLHNIHSDYASGRQRWKGQDSDGNNVDIQYNGIVGNIGISSEGDETVFFVAPDRFLGDQRSSYNQFLSFDYRAGDDGARASRLDVVFEGSGLLVSTPIYSQGNPVPRTLDQTFKFRLNEHPDNAWSPRLTSFDFIRLLSNVTTIKIRGVYNTGGTGFLDDVKLGSARRGAGRERATHVEQCQCPDGYVGQFCESCAPGYHRDPPNGGAFGKCVPCDCNGHSDSCDVNTGRCICQHNTAGDNCERCGQGFYGYALAGTADDCKACPCPDHGECVQLLNDEVACIDCQEGYTGNRCEMCADGYYGDPEGRYGPRRACQPCTCNANLDPNAVGNCNSTSGECIKCIYNTGGRFCERCLPGYYGDALGRTKGLCVACDCYPAGTIHRPTEEIISCHSQTGQCTCQPNVVGRKCDTCQDGYWHIDRATVLRCEPCFCDRVGAHNQTCDIHNGKCYCKDGVSGRTCGTCETYHYGFNWDGCKGCDCDPEGSMDLQCDDVDGRCPCKPNVEGRQCDRCMENKFNITAGCIDCPACYSLVQERITIHRHKVNELRELIENIGKNPGQINDTDFRKRMNEVNETVVQLVNDARKAVGSDGPLGDQLQELRDAIKNLMMECSNVHGELEDARAASSNAVTDISAAERAIEEAETALREAEKYIEMEGQDALRKAKEAQERFGQQSQRMTEIAKQARVEAERQEEEAMRIEETAKRALNTSQEAQRLAQEALQKPEDTELDIQQLDRDVTDAEHLYEQTKAMAERAQQQAQDAYSDSLKIFSQAKSLSKPDINVVQLQEEASSIKDESGRIKEEADRLIDQHRDLMEDVESQKQQAENMLENGIRQQQIADELLADADYARDVGRKALHKAEMTLQDANDTLKTLKEFDQKVQDSKLQAAKALDKIPDIENQILEAERKTREARNNLAGAEADAISARDIAQQAQDVADMASEEAGDIRAQADTTKSEASDLHKKVGEIAKDVLDAERRLQNYENQAEEDKRLAEEALSKADAAKTSAKASSDLVSGGLDTVNDILVLLDGLEEIDMTKLDELEESMRGAERQINETQLEERYTMLINARNQHQQWINMFTDELIQLRADVNNVQQINATIPRTCFKRVDLEVTGPRA